MKNLIFALFCIALLYNNIFSQEKVWFQEEFNENLYGWSVTDHESYLTEMDSGVYRITHKRESGSWNFWIPVCIIQDKDFTIEAKIVQTDGITNHGYGIVWGTKDASNSYSFIVSSDNQFQINQYKAGTFEKIIDWQTIEAVYPKGEANILKIHKEDNALSFYVNGVKVQSLWHQPFKGTNLGFVLNNSMTIEADYIKVLQDNSINLVDNPINGYQPENLGENINSAYDEITPVISPDGKTIFVCRKNHPENIENPDKDDIWFSIIDENGIWGPLRNIGKPLNNGGHNSVISVSPDGKTLLLMNTYNNDGSAKGPGISITTKSKYGWTMPLTVEIEDYYNKNRYSNFCLSADQNTLIMAVERIDSYGDQDLYVSFKAGDIYLKPLNLGPQLNTYAADISPFLAADNTTLYYSTIGKPGYGNSDIFVTKRLDDTWTNWSEPKNLGPEINTTRWDAYYSIPASGEYAVLSSAKNSLGKGDIQKIKQPEDARPDPVVLIYGHVLNAKTIEPLEAKIIYSDLTTDAIAGTASSEPNSGFYKIILPYGKNYSFLAAKTGFYSISENMDVSDILGYMEIEKDLYLSPIEVGEIIRLNNIFFDYNNAELKPDSYAELNRLIKILDEYPRMVIEIGGHTDSDGAETYNLDLSQKRVNSVIEYLTKNDLDIKRIQGKGYGESKPIVPNTTDEGMARNRRVEFTILKK